MDWLLEEGALEQFVTLSKTPWARGLEFEPRFQLLRDFARNNEYSEEAELCFIEAYSYIDGCYLAKYRDSFDYIMKIWKSGRDVDDFSPAN